MAQLMRTVPRRLSRRLSGWLGAAAALPLMAAGASLAADAPAKAAAVSQVLYSLSTRCSIEGAAPKTCVVEVVDEGSATLYRHRIGAVTMTVRITDKPVRMERWNGAKKTWQPLKEAAARFSTNTICFNGRDLCVVNPNYLNSVRQDRPDATAGRDLVMVRFDGTGRVNLTCYDDGCKGVKS
jgi:hypothetical protein